MKAPYICLGLVFQLLCLLFQGFESLTNKLSMLFFHVRILLWLVHDRLTFFRIVISASNER